jgi:cytoskeletal protein RodZ
MAEDTPQNELFLNPSRRSYVYESSKGSGNKKRVILIILGVIVLIALVAYAIIATGGKGELDEALTPTPTTIQETPTPTITEVTPTPEESPTPTSKISPTPTTKGTPTPTKASASDLDRSNLSLEVQNGSGVAGAATKMSDALKKLGYTVASSGNADNFDYEKTEIQLKSTKKAYLEMLKKDLGDDYTISSATSDYAGDADGVVIVGKE